jgi:hypothetical protein
MKLQLLSLLLLIGIFSCGKPEPKTEELTEENLSLLQNYAELTHKLTAKYYYDFQWDLGGRLVYLASKSIYEKCDSLSKKLVELKGEKDLKIIQEKSQQYFEVLNQIVFRDSQKEILKEIKPLENASTNLDNNLLTIWIFSNKCLNKLHRNLSANCGLGNTLILESKLEKEKYRLGDTVRTISSFDDVNKFDFNSQSLYLKYPTKIKSVILNDSIFKPKNMISHFENEYVEFIPTQIGKYTITFSKTIERVNKKIATYESKVEFTVLP